jgi:hypothetical protein
LAAENKQRQEKAAKNKLIFGGRRSLTQPPKISVFSAASDTVAENTYLFSTATSWPPKIKYLKTSGSFFSVLCFFSLSSRVCRR